MFKRLLRIIIANDELISCIIMIFQYADKENLGRTPLLRAKSQPLQELEVIYSFDYLIIFENKSHIICSVGFQASLFCIFLDTSGPDSCISCSDEVCQWPEHRTRASIHQSFEENNYQFSCEGFIQPIGQLISIILSQCNGLIFVWSGRKTQTMARDWLPAHFFPPFPQLNRTGTYTDFTFICTNLLK